MGIGKAMAQRFRLGLSILLILVPTVASAASPQSGVPISIDKAPPFSLWISGEGKAKYVGDALEINFTFIRLARNPKFAHLATPVWGVKVAVRRKDENFYSDVLHVPVSGGMVYTSGITLPQLSFRLPLKPTSDDLEVRLIALETRDEKAAWLSDSVRIRASSINACKDLVEVKLADGRHATFDVARYIAEQGSVQAALAAVHRELQKGAGDQFRTIAASLACWQ